MRRQQQFAVWDWLKYHWFWIAAAVMVIDVANMPWAFASMPRLLESLVLGELAVVIPGCYWLCYRRNGRRAVVYALALAALGLWVASKLVPSEAHYLLTYLWPLRYVELAIVGVLEIRIAFAVYRAIFKGTDAEQVVADLQAKTEMPPWLARLMVLEARFWKGLATFFVRLLRRRK